LRAWFIWVDWLDWIHDAECLDSPCRSNRECQQKTGRLGRHRQECITYVEVPLFVSDNVVGKKLKYTYI
jgi:hypothetical protein